MGTSECGDDGKEVVSSIIYRVGSEIGLQGVISFSFLFYGGV